MATGSRATNRQAFNAQCGDARGKEIDAKVGAAVRASGTGVLNYERTLENIRNCGVLRQAKAAEVAAAIAAG